VPSRIIKMLVGGNIMSTVCDKCRSTAYELKADQKSSLVLEEQKTSNTSN